MLSSHKVPFCVRQREHNFFLGCRDSNTSRCDRNLVYNHWAKLRTYSKFRQFRRYSSSSNHSGAKWLARHEIEPIPSFQPAATTFVFPFCLILILHMYVGRWAADDRSGRPAGGQAKLPDGGAARTPAHPGPRPTRGDCALWPRAHSRARRARQRRRGIRILWGQFPAFVAYNVLSQYFLLH